MATKKKSKKVKKSKTVTRGTRTAAPRNRDQAAKNLTNLADHIVNMAAKGKDPSIEIPVRSLSNVKFNPRSKVIEMGKNTQNRSFFNYGQAKRFMQTILVASKCKELIDAGKTASIRQVYYMSKHTIKGTIEKTFDDQSESDPVLEDLEVTTGSLREQLHIFADSKGAMIGDIQFMDSGDLIDASKLGSGGYAIPSIVEPQVIQFKKCKAKYVLHVEKGTIWRRFVEDKFWQKHRCILTHGGGQPPRGVRRMLYRLHHELKLPIYLLLDNDPWGYYIYSVIKQGSINLAFESRRMAIPAARFIGVSSFDYDRFGLTDDVKIALDQNDLKRTKQILAYPWFKGNKRWEKEIKKMIKNGFKMEVEAMISKSLTFLTDEYAPRKIKSKSEWLD